MPRGRNKAIPPRRRDYPEYTYVEYPKIIGKHPDTGDSLRADSKAHEAELRRQFPGLPAWIPPPTSLSMKDMRSLVEERDSLRAEVARLKAMGVEVALPDNVLQSKEADEQADAPQSGEDAPSHQATPGTAAELVAAGEHPAGDPWADQPENADPATSAKPPSIKDRGRTPPPSNKLAASGGRR